MRANTKQLYFNGRSSGSNLKEWIYCEEGKIRRIGKGEAPTALGKEVLKYDMQCGFVLPGFIDSHIHIHLLGEMQRQIRLHSARSAKDLLSLIEDSLKKTPAGAVIRGFGWDESKWEHPALPSLRELDALTQDRPCLLSRIDAHAGLANSALLKLAGIERGRKIAGGFIGTDADGSPTGLLKEKSYEKALAALPTPTPQEQDTSLLAAQRECIRQGITSVHEVCANKSIVDSIERCDREKKLKLFVNVALYDDAVEAGLLSGPASNDRLLQGEQRWRAFGVKFFLDGSLGSRSALLHTPYSDAPETSGIQLMSLEELTQGVQRALSHGFQPLVHAIGPKACHIALQAFEMARKALPDNELRCRIEHGEILIPQDILYAAKIGAIFAIQPMHIVSDSAWLETRLGKTVAKCAGTWNSMMKAGLRLAGGSDAPMDVLSPFAGIVAASQRPQHFPEEAIARSEAIKLYTENAAYAAHQERIMGSLREGALANFAVFDRDPKMSSSDKLLQTTVLQTVIAGEAEHSVYY